MDVMSVIVNEQQTNAKRLQTSLASLAMENKSRYVGRGQLFMFVRLDQNGLFGTSGDQF